MTVEPEKAFSKRIAADAGSPVTASGTAPKLRVGRALLKDAEFEVAGAACESDRDKFREYRPDVWECLFFLSLLATILLSPLFFPPGP